LSYQSPKSFIPLEFASYHDAPMVQWYEAYNLPLFGD